MNRIYAPLFEMLRELAERQPASFHVPGHRYGQAFHAIEDEAADAFHSIMKLDVTELSTTDDLHHPEGAIAEAQRLAALCFGADETCFLVGGSTSGNIALLLAVCQPGDTIIVQRNVHKSVINGLKLAGARAAFISPQMDECTGKATSPSLRTIEEALNRYPEARAVFLTNPNYYGMSINLKPYAKLIHQAGKMLLVDEAHGAHYGFHPQLPLSAIQAGADAVVQSTHKTLTALTMGAMLHMQGERLPRAAVRQALAIVQSSSPSFPIMTSLDISRAMIDRHREAWFEPAISEANRFRQWLASRKPQLLHTVHPNERSNAYDQLDPLRVLLSDATGLQSGYELQSMLEQQNIWAEMADLRHVVLLFGIQANQSETERLMEACEQLERLILSSAAASGESERSITEAVPHRHQSDVQCDEILVGAPIIMSRAKAPSIRLPLEEAEGRVAAEMVVPYPPGIPVVYPGERLTAVSIRYIGQLALHNAKFQGAADPSMRTIEVLQ